jgi:hypothetical protein
MHFPTEYFLYAYFQMSILLLNERRNLPVSGSKDCRSRPAKFAGQGRREEFFFTVR